MNLNIYRSNKKQARCQLFIFLCVKKTVKLLLLTIFLNACMPSAVDTPHKPTERFPARAKDMVIYEVNIRQYTPEGNFMAFSEHLPRIKAMGIDILWLMPIQPIGEERRKGKLGSYYSVQDYRKINPEFGTDEDFKTLVNKVHNLDMLLIMDWVPNHTAWDHSWITTHPDYYAKDEKGETVMAHDWADVAQLDYDNEEMRESMIADMTYWVETFDIDGFRQDHAGHEIPIDFWQDATEELNPLKDLFWLAEWNSPQMHFAFHATYAWAFHHLLGEIARGEKRASALDKHLRKDRHDYGKYAYRMTFSSNHDENSWQGTVFERYGDGYKTMAVLAATIGGIPMLYGGQEAKMDKRLRFFEKDTIDWSKIPLQDFYTTLFQLRKKNQALWSGGYGGRPVQINATNKENVYAFSRSKNGHQVVVLLNLTRENQTFELKPWVAIGSQEEIFTGKSVELVPNKMLELAPWEYQLFAINEEAR